MIVAPPLDRDPRCIDTTTKEVQAEIATIIATMNTPPRHISSRGNWSSSSSGTSFGLGFGRVSENSNGRSVERAWPTVAVAVAALAAWLLGVRWMARRFGPRG